MNVEKFAAHYMLSAGGSLVKWPVVTIGEKGVILKTETHPEGFREQPGIRFFSGILIPGFIDVFGDLLIETIDDEKRFLNRHFSSGTLILGVSRKMQDIFSRQGGLPAVIPERIKHEKFDPVFDPVVDANISMLEKIKKADGADSGLLLSELLAYVTRDAALAVGLSDFGILKEGGTPGLLLLQNADLINLRMRPQTTVKWLNVPDLPVELLF